MVRAARHAGDGLLTARRPRRSPLVDRLDHAPFFDGLLRDPTLARIGAAHACSAAAVALAWTIRSGNVIAIPESGSAEHVRENALALSLTLTSDELHTLDAAHPLPNR